MSHLSPTTDYSVAACLLRLGVIMVGVQLWHVATAMKIWMMRIGKVSAVPVEPGELCGCLGSGVQGSSDVETGCGLDEGRAIAFRAALLCSEDEGILFLPHGSPHDPNAVSKLVCC